MKCGSRDFSRRDFLKQSSAVLGAAGCAALSGIVREPTTALAGNERPNILFLFADDYCFSLIHALGCDEIQTPNLDRLVRRGIHFTNCYNQGGWHGAVCVASRTMLLTGRFLWEAQGLDPHMEDECRGGRLWPQYFRQAGYRAYMSGKWHVNCDASQVFDETRHVRPGMPPDITEQYKRPQEGKPDLFDSTAPELGGYYTGGKHWSEVVGDDGVDFLKDRSRGDAPFFMYLAFNAPHDPRQAPRSFLDLYTPEEIGMPVNFQPEHPFKDVIGCGAGLRDERLAPFPRTEEAVRVHRREYYAIITHLDAQIGRILDALDDSGQADNTQIIFTADNGLAAGNHGLFGKQNMYEHSMKVPLILCGPAIAAAKSSDALVYLQDIVPTTLELAGIPIPAHVSYQSLLPVLRGTDTGGYEAIYGAYQDLQRMIRVGSFKMIYYPAVEHLELFDLSVDPQEQHSLARDSRYEEQVRALCAQLEAVQLALKDPIKKTLDKS